uniref:Uncharacterized protein n=1 Tax=Pararge aegeria TaxID=116150 RepID=S4NMD3_9NEOP
MAFYYDLAILRLSSYHGMRSETMSRHLFIFWTYSYVLLNYLKELMCRSNHSTRVKIRILTFIRKLFYFSEHSTKK